MTSIQLFWLILGSTWASVEIAIAVKTRALLTPTSALEYRSERFIWLVVALALLLALWLKQQHLAPLPFAPVSRQICAVALFSAGLSLRFAAVLTLGSFFSTSVITQDRHVLVENGPYRWIRHPAYTGLLGCFLAAGVAMGDCLALLSLLGPIAYVLKQRMQVEEQCLQQHFGQAYAAYCRKTRKLLPGIY